MSNKQIILDIIERAKRAIPNILKQDRPVSELSGRPEMHNFEHEIWGLGEKIRPILIKNPSLRKDREIQENIINICLNQKAKRGRESFLMLMGNVSFSKYADKVASLTTDPYISGHAVDTLLKMRQPGFYNEVAPFLESKITWIKKAAKKYCDKYGSL